MNYSTTNDGGIYISSSNTWAEKMPLHMPVDTQSHCSLKMRGGDSILFSVAKGEVPFEIYKKNTPPNEVKDDSFIESFTIAENKS